MTTKRTRYRGLWSYDGLYIFAAYIPAAALPEYD